MKRFDWAVLILIAAAAAIALCIQKMVDPCICVSVFVALFLLLFVVAIVRRAKLRKVRMREAELKKTLEEGQKELERERAAFFSDISHSMRMPVSIIQGYAELLKHGDADKRTETEYIDKILDHTHRLTEMLSSKLGSNSAGIMRALGERQEVDLLKLVQQQMDDLRNSAIICGVSLQVVAAGDPIMVDVDVQQMQRVFFNLVENAVKYMGREGLVTVLLTQKDNFASVTFRDDGLGMREEEVPHIFTDTYRGSNSLYGTGAGHGLFLVKEIIRAHGGQISASSNPGHGLSIQFTLPLAKR